MHWSRTLSNSFVYFCKLAKKKLITNQLIQFISVFYYATTQLPQNDQLVLSPCSPQVAPHTSFPPSQSHSFWLIVAYLFFVWWPSKAMMVCIFFHHLIHRPKWCQNASLICSALVSCFPQYLSHHECLLLVGCCLNLKNGGQHPKYKHQSQWEHNWCHVPCVIRFGSMADVAIERRGRGATGSRVAQLLFLFFCVFLCDVLCLCIQAM